MTMLIVLFVCVYSISVIAAYEAGAWDRRNQGTTIDGQWWVDGIKQIDEEEFKFE